MGKVKKLEIRRIWVICCLLNGEKWLHDDITKHLNELDDLILRNYIDEEKESYKAILPDLIESSKQELPDELKLTIKQAKSNLGRSNKKISKEMVSKVLKNLRKNKIIERTVLEKDGRGPDPYEYRLIDNFKALRTILKIFYDTELDPYFSSILGSMFISSSYAKKLIPMLLKAVNENMRFSFNEKEEKSVLNILLSSPRAVLVATEYLDFDIGSRPTMTLEGEYDGKVELFLLRLQLKLGEDIMHLALPKGTKSFEYKISVSFNEDQLEKDDISKVIKEDVVQTTILPKFSEDVYMNFLTNMDYSPL